MSEEKKFLDYEGVKYLWSKINMQDYPNNTTLINVINAIDETKANKEDLNKYLDTTGDYMTGPLGLTQNTNYGQNFPTNSNVGEIFFLEDTEQIGNDYAEYRNCIDNFIPGYVVCENGKDNLTLSSERLQPACYVVSDTFGSIIGHYQNCPVAVSGRVLVYINEDIQNIHVGDVVAAGPDGKAIIMTREEIKEYPDRILGIVCSIPKEEIWNNIYVNGRIWIKI